MELLISNIASGVKQVVSNGIRYIVADITMIVPGVLAGSKGPILYKDNDVSGSADTWNGIPLTIRHPVINDRPVSARTPEIAEQYTVGTIYNSRYENNKLKAEGWFDAEKTKMKDIRVYNALMEGRKMEVSTGLFMDQEEAMVGSQYNGVVYSYVAKNYRPDHLAVLPDERGACSLNDGCGLHVNKSSLIVNKFSSWLVSNCGKSCKCKKCKEKYKEEDKTMSVVANFANWLVDNCGGKGGKPGPCKGTGLSGTSRGASKGIKAPAPVSKPNPVKVKPASKTSIAASLKGTKPAKPAVGPEHGDTKAMHRARQSLATAQTMYTHHSKQLADIYAHIDKHGTSQSLNRVAATHRNGIDRASKAIEKHTSTIDKGLEKNNNKRLLKQQRESAKAAKSKFEAAKVELGLKKPRVKKSEVQSTPKSILTSTRGKLSNKSVELPPKVRKMVEDRSGKKIVAERQAEARASISSLRTQATKINEQSSKSYADKGKLAKINYEAGKAAKFIGKSGKSFRGQTSRGTVTRSGAKDSSTKEFKKYVEEVHQDKMFGKK